MLGDVETTGPFPAVLTTPSTSARLPDDLRVLYTGSDGHLYVARGDGVHTSRLTWSHDDFATIPGLPSLPGTLGELEDSYVFAHPSPSPDGEKVAVFGLLPTSEEEIAFFDEDFAEEESWSDVEEALEELTDSLWDEEDADREDDVAGPGVVFALVTEDGEELVHGDLEQMVDLAAGDDDEDDDDYDEDPDDEDLDAIDVPMYWPGGKLYVVHNDGVQVWEAWDAAAGSPTHLEWAPDGRSLLLLHQEEERLHLVLVDGEASGASLTLASGLPLFWDWQPGGRTLALRVTDPETEVSLLQLLEVGDRSAPRTLGEAGSFYSPAWSPDGTRLAYALAGGREDRILVADAAGAEEHVLGTFDGRAAFRWDGTGRYLAVGLAEDDEGAFGRLELHDLEADGSRTLFHGTFVAFRWLPNDTGLLICQADEDDDRLHWVVAGLDGSVRPVGVPFVPSREAAVGLHFFEQLGRSHPFLSDDGRFVVFSGRALDDVDERGPGQEPLPHLLERGEDEPPAIYVAPLDGGPTVVVGHGHFACFG